MLRCMRTERTRAALVVLLMSACTVGLCACDSDPAEPYSCTGEYAPGISVRVLDAQTRLPLACVSSAWVIEGAYYAAMQGVCIGSFQDEWLRGAYERPGTYTVLVASPGYRPWSRTNVVVSADPCHVHTVELEALLEPGGE